MTCLAEAQRQYQAALEAHRIDPDDDAVYEELCQLRQVRDIAWLAEVTK